MEQRGESLYGKYCVSIHVNGRGDAKLEGCASRRTSIKAAQCVCKRAHTSDDLQEKRCDIVIDCRIIIR